DDAERGGRGAVEGGAVGGVDGPGERVVPQQGDGAEVGEHVQRDEQSAARRGRPELGQRDPQEGAQGAVAEGAGGLLLGRVDAAQGGGDRQVDVGEADEGKGERGAGEARDLRHGGQPDEGGDVAGHGERQGGQDRPGARAGQVGAHGEPGQGDAEDEAGRHDDGGQAEAAAEELEGAFGGDDVPGVSGSAFEGADGEVAEG